MFMQHQQSSTTGSTAGAALGSPIAVAAVHFIPSATQGAAASCAGKTALSELPRGGKAIIRDIRAQGVLGRRLRDMGLLPGVAVELVSRAPLGDPLVVALDGYTLSVRCTEAACVIVEMTQ